MFLVVGGMLCKSDKPSIIIIIIICFYCSVVHLSLALYLISLNIRDHKWTVTANFTNGP